MLVQCWPTVYDADTTLGQCLGFTIVTVWIPSKHDMPTQCWIDVVDCGSPLSLQLFLLSGVLAAWPWCDCWASSWSCCLVYWRYDRHVIVEPPVGPAVWCTGGMAVMWLLSLQLFLLSGVLAVWPWWDCWASSWSCCLVYWRYGRHVIVEPPVGPAVWCIGGMAVMWLLSLQLFLLSGVLAVWPWWDCWASSWSCCLVYWRYGRHVIVEPPVGPAVWCIGGMAVMWLLSLQLVLLSGVLAVWPSCDCWASSWSCCLVYWRHGRDGIVEPPVVPAVWCTGGMAVMWLLSLQLVLLSGVLAAWPWWDCCIKWKWVSEGIVLSPSTAGTDYIRFFIFLLTYCVSAFKQVEYIKWHKSAGI